MRGTPADLELRIVKRAAALPESDRLRSALGDIGRGMRAMVIGGLILGAIAGALAAKSALANHVASIFALIAGLLGLQTLMLVIWLAALIVLGRNARGGAIGSLLLTAGRAVAMKVHRSTAHIAAAEAFATLLSAPRIGKWTVATITHAAWAAINLGMLAGLALLFIGQGYEFRWDSTWLSEPQYARLIDTLAAGPGALGFDVPDAEAIAASRETLDEPQSQDVRRAWSWMFFGCVVVYGFLPRAILLVMSLALRARALRAYRLDLARPGFARLRDALMPSSSHDEVPPPASGAIADDDHARRAAEEEHTKGAASKPVGPPAIVAVELRDPACGWPPPFTHEVRDLGNVDGRDDQHSVLDLLARDRTTPAALLIVADFANSPDRGVERFIASLASAASAGRAHLILTGGHRLHDRAGAEGVARRAADWRTLAGHAGIAAERVKEIDLDSLTARTRGQLDAIAAPGETSHPRPVEPQRFDRALRTIIEHANGWPREVDQKAALTLHEAVARVYEHNRAAWMTQFTGLTNVGFASIAANPESLRSTIEGGARRITQMLPPSLRAKPKWMAAGALAGALGCIAAAGFISPVAIAALPTWSIIGAAVAAFAPTRAARESADDASRHAAAFDEAVRAAALFAVVLELQGREQAQISRVIERTFADLEDDDDRMIARDDLPQWIGDVQRRFGSALAQESPP